MGGVDWISRTALAGVIQLKKPPRTLLLLLRLLAVLFAGPLPCPRLSATDVLPFSPFLSFSLYLFSCRRRRLLLLLFDFLCWQSSSPFTWSLSFISFAFVSVSSHVDINDDRVDGSLSMSDRLGYRFFAFFFSSCHSLLSLRLRENGGRRDGGDRHSFVVFCVSSHSE